MFRGVCMIEYFLILLLMAIFLLIFVFDATKREQERQSKETRNHDVQARMDTCLKCGKKISQFTKTCPYCGYNNRTSPKKCPKCGNHNPYDSIYCEECGTKLVKSTTDTIKTQTPKYEKTITCPNCKKTFRKDTFTYEKYNRCPHCQYNFKTSIKPQTIRKNSQVKKPNIQTQIDGKFKIQIPSLYEDYQKHGTTTAQLLNEIQEINRVYERIDKLGGTNYIKQQLKTKSTYKIAQEHNITPENLKQYCQKHGTSINQLTKEIDRDNAKERERQRRRKQQQEHERQHKINQQILEINRVYERIDKLGGTNYIKQQLKTKSTYKIAQEHNITRRNLKQYCQKHGTSINQLQNDIEQERQIQEAYEIIDRLGGTEHIKNLLKTTNPEQIVRVYNITTENLNEYCQNHGTSINQLTKEIDRDNAKERERQRLEKEKQQEQERQDRYMKNLKNEKRMRDY